MIAWREPARIVVIILALFAAVEVGRDAYRWVAYRGERASMRALSPALEISGLNVMRSGLRVDSLRARIDARDRVLDRMRAEIDRYEKQSAGEGVPEEVYESYRSTIEAYNSQVAERNGWLRELQEALRRNAVAAERYTTLADSMRSLAVRMGDAYYQVPTPSELALKHGLRPPSANGAPVP
ncbi:MAG TPA: hypothetical protein VFI96_01035 [Longimicrobiaceae bacterium]|nr:hypothetical protein [Longimicrobiaceae bacterium]